MELYLHSIYAFMGCARQVLLATEESSFEFWQRQPISGMKEFSRDSSLSPIAGIVF
jgi:hypothetical protein